MLTNIMKRVTRFGAELSVIFGGIGMLLCIPYLMISFDHIMIIIGAGIVFLTGAVLCGAGIVALSILAGQKNEG